jgi:hypothetical protein
MEMRVRLSRLVCATSLPVLIASCASTDKRVSASPAEAGLSSGSSTSSASSGPLPSSPSPAPQPQDPSRQPSQPHAPTPQSQAPVPQPQAPAPQPQAPAPQPQAPAPQPKAPAPQPQAPAPQPQPPAPRPPNPNPPPGTVSYDLPNVGGSDLADQDNWRAGYANKCTTAGHPANCLHMSVVVSAVGPDGKPAPIPNPGAGYFAAGVYESCPVTAITPEPPVEVPVGTTVVIKVLCQPVAGGAA